ncbi:preprotein translocase subunit SecA, partial [Candidatus Saccharibacteria bacterium]|nr:preprotein translocase subunit SecA [Candidatus Saccharibacteria bacterium]
MKKLVKKVLGDPEAKTLKRMRKRVKDVNALQDEFKKLSDSALRRKTEDLQKKLSEKGQTLDSILPEAFATVREMAWREIKQRHYDVQLIGGMVLHEGMVAEMKTGEGKTLVATLPTYLNALTEQGVHLITVNDYLARRDAKWMEPIYSFLGMSVGVNVAGLSPEEKKQAYNADITYGTNNEFGFDYLRDNMKYSS